MGGDRDLSRGGVGDPALWGGVTLAVSGRRSGLVVFVFDECGGELVHGFEDVGGGGVDDDDGDVVDTMYVMMNHHG